MFTYEGKKCAHVHLYTVQWIEINSGLFVRKMPVMKDS